MTQTRWRKIKSALFVGFCILSVVAALIPLFLIFFFVVGQGIRSLSWDFFTKMPKPVGESGGGMDNVIMGNLMLT
jgi:phosphate transport system permease protein